MKRLAVAVVSFLVIAGLVAPVFAGGQYDHIISAADVEKATGPTGVKQAPREKLSRFRNGDLNFVMKDDRPILMVQFRPLFLYDQMKSDPGYFMAAVPGVGGAAFTTPDFAHQFSVIFIKGDHFAIVTTHVDPKDQNKMVLTMARSSPCPSWSRRRCKL
jgi:hypothetical protein